MILRYAAWRNRHADHEVVRAVPLRARLPDAALVSAVMTLTSSAIAPFTSPACRGISSTRLRSSRPKASSYPSSASSAVLRDSIAGARPKRRAPTSGARLFPGDHGRS
jgi:hypothetical protein